MKTVIKILDINETQGDGPNPLFIVVLIVSGINKIICKMFTNLVFSFSPLQEVVVS